MIKQLGRDGGNVRNCSTVLDTPKKLDMNASQVRQELMRGSGNVISSGFDNGPATSSY